MRPLLWGGLLLVSLLLVSCARAARVVPEQPSSLGVEVQPAVQDVEKAASEAPSAASEAAPVVQQKIVYTASLTLRVEDVPAAMDALVQETKALGGYILRSAQQTQRLPDGRTVIRGELSVRVPAENLDEALRRYRRIALEVLHDEVTSKDVTEEYIDIEARLRNLRATEEELRNFLNKARTTDEVLKIYDQLQRVREEIERLEGRRRYLEQVTTYALVDIILQPKEVPPPVVPESWSAKAVAQAAVRALVRTLQALATLGIWLVLYLLPVLLIVALPMALAVWVARRMYQRMRSRRQTQTG